MSQRVVSGLKASAAPGGWQRLRPHPRPTDPGTPGVGPDTCVLGGSGAHSGLRPTDPEYTESPKNIPEGNTSIHPQDGNILHIKLTL